MLRGTRAAPLAFRRIIRPRGSPSQLESRTAPAARWKYAAAAGTLGTNAQPSCGGQPVSEVTRILSAIEGGDPSAAAQLLPLVYEELRRLAARQLAQEQPGQTLQPTALVHEAYLRLVGSGTEPQWNSRGHFFAAAAQAMRHIL